MVFGSGNGHARYWREGFHKTNVVPMLGNKWSPEKTGIEQACITDSCHPRGSTAQFGALSLWYLEPALEVSASFAVCCLMTLNVPLSSPGLLATQGQRELLVKILIGFAPFLGVSLL